MATIKIDRFALNALRALDPQMNQANVTQDANGLFVVTIDNDTVLALARLKSGTETISDTLVRLYNKLEGVQH